MYETFIGNFETAEEAIRALESKVKKEEPKSKLLFVLTMPNVGSWNGRWSGERDMYARLRSAKDFPNCKEDDHYYSWNDGWGASVSVRRVTAKEANKTMKQSKGFCGYDWMIDSILKFGCIMNSREAEECAQACDSVTL